MNNSRNIFPSPLTKLKLIYQNQNGNSVEVPFSIPKNEVFRIKDVIEEGCYSLPNFRRSNSPDIIVDIGANVGCYTMYIKMNNPNASIYCFEPVPAITELLSQNTAIFSNIYIKNIALSNKNETGWIDIHPVNSGENRLRNETSQKGNHKSSIEIPVHDASNVFTNLGLEHIDILKIDTEGCEVQILKSLRKRLWNIDYIVLEYHSEKDRRHIDAILNEFTLISCSVSNCGLGVLKYINESLLSMM